MKFFATTLLTSLLSLTCMPASAFGLSVSPTAVLLDSKSLYGYVELTNTTEYAKLFDVEFEDPALGACLRVSPRQISISPGQTQVIRMQYTCVTQPMPENPMVYFVEQVRSQRAFAQDNQLDFRLRLGLKIKLQSNPTQSLF